MRLRETRIGGLVELLREKSREFTQPPLIVIGGYALRAYVPMTRYSRDCDFAIPKDKAWNIDRILKWLNGLTVEALEKADAYAYLRAVQLISAGKAKIKIALDFMEGGSAIGQEQCLSWMAGFYKTAQCLRSKLLIGSSPFECHRIKITFC